ncbi:hypothetical protein F503_01313 [Ophiostoma piceae UAMH 11346]|uniref:Uncharacterized protein n=1 Tax=Ophiostoma piceae (strain UAMH 11346) TaxID=1262450 RepID=S3BSR7_OPHP1|nr:hypothetical protein F503_01313 [Ophiostoma piceae UAMH 11346]
MPPQDANPQPEGLCIRVKTEPATETDTLSDATGTISHEVKTLCQTSDTLSQTSETLSHASGTVTDTMSCATIKDEQQDNEGEQAGHPQPSSRNMLAQSLVPPDVRAWAGPAHSFPPRFPFYGV